MTKKLPKVSKTHISKIRRMAADAASRRIRAAFIPNIEQPDSENRLCFAIVEKAIHDLAGINGATRPEYKGAKRYLGDYDIPHAEVCGVDTVWIQETLAAVGLPVRNEDVPDLMKKAVTGINTVEVRIRNIILQQEKEKEDRIARLKAEKAEAARKRAEKAKAAKARRDWRKRPAPKQKVSKPATYRI